MCAANTQPYTIPTFRRPKRSAHSATVGGTVAGVTNVNNTTVNYFLDGRPISREELAAPMKLAPGEHVLTLRDRDGKEEVRRGRFRAAAGPASSSSSARFAAVARTR